MEKIFAIRDLKLENYMTPMFAPHQVVIIRQLTEAIKDEKTSLNKFPEDYDLFELGSWDASHAKFAIHEHPKHICTIASLQIGINNDN